MSKPIGHAALPVMQLLTKKLCRWCFAATFLCGACLLVATSSDGHFWLSLSVGAQCSFFEHRSYKIIYRRYASLFFMVGVDEDEVSGCPCKHLAYLL